jgi:hypothetical protein
VDVVVSSAVVAVESLEPRLVEVVVTGRVVVDVGGRAVVAGVEDDVSAAEETVVAAESPLRVPWAMSSPPEHAPASRQRDRTTGAIHFLLVGSPQVPFACLTLSGAS